MACREDGEYVVNVQASDQTFSKQRSGWFGPAAIISRAPAGKILGAACFFSAESALPENSFIEAIAVQYPAREIAFAGLEWNWIWLFFVLSLVAGFVFKSILGIEI